MKEKTKENDFGSELGKVLFIFALAMFLGLEIGELLFH